MNFPVYINEMKPSRESNYEEKKAVAVAASLAHRTKKKVYY
jgi:hypothetical protein